MRRSAATAVLAGACGCALMGGCTFLISFDDVPTGDASVSVPTSHAPDVVVVDVADPDQKTAAPPDARVDAPAIDYSAVCKGKLDGKYCDGDMIGVDGGNKDDLITCLAGKTVAVKTCTSGTGCVAMPSGYPDECDECQGKATGLYCGDDFVGWDPKNANTRIRCDNGRIVGNLVCATKCVGTGPNASCQ